MGFIVAHNRDRDWYHVPLALAEVGLLDRFVTDYYTGASRIHVPTLGHRRTRGIDPDAVVCSWPALIAQLPFEAARRWYPLDFPSYVVESALGHTVAAVARQCPKSDLLLYSGSARQAFRGPTTGRRVLFQYHPSPSFIEGVVEGVDELADAGDWIQEAEVDSPTRDRAHQEEVARADLVLCASTFTKTGLIAEGVEPERIKVVPYGTPPISSVDPVPAVDPVCRFIFVGQGVARKGLHLLIEAWRRASLDRATLTLVTSRLDPAIAEFGRSVPGIEWVGRLSRADLDRRLSASDTLVLPSLVEGFGLVLGEGLASGTRLIATRNTGLPDMEVPAGLATIVEPGRVEPLRQALVDHAATYLAERPYREDALTAADRLSWVNFRGAVRRGLGL
ncbi:MAG: glycosyltransferase family 4 protein [Tetrasphaera sp.]|jgi:glycosyltransferase involved in cell wall biosynthesis|nr:glycosyltransferase family 4 protein [Tetrasphaera sp.]